MGIFSPITTTYRSSLNSQNWPSYDLKTVPGLQIQTGPGSFLCPFFPCRFMFPTSCHHRVAFKCIDDKKTIMKELWHIYEFSIVHSSFRVQGLEMQLFSLLIWGQNKQVHRLRGRNLSKNDYLIVILRPLMKELRRIYRNLHSQGAGPRNGTFCDFWSEAKMSKPIVSAVEI